jgi:Domain of unknown function (DUF1707)
MAEPGDEIAISAGGRGHLRASNADREQVIGLLQAAFVQGRLTKDEFDLRVGRALMSRTFAELAALTADIPAGLTGAEPPQPIREWNEKKAAAAVLGAIAAWWSIVVAASLWAGDNASAQRSVGVAIALVLLHLSIVSILLIALWLKRRDSRQSARGRSQKGSEASPDRRAINLRYSA